MQKYCIYVKKYTIKFVFHILMLYLCYANKRDGECTSQI